MDRRSRGDDSLDQSSVDITGFSERKRELGQILATVGVWPWRIPDLLARYSAERIAVNFELYRQRAQMVQDGGAWLTAAITEGYALPSSSGADADAPVCTDTSAEAQNGTSPPGRTLPSPGMKVSASRRQDLLEAGLASREDFDRAPPDERGVPCYFYKLDPGPSRAAPILRRAANLCR